MERADAQQRRLGAADGSQQLYTLERERDGYRWTVGLA